MAIGWVLALAWTASGRSLARGIDTHQQRRTPVTTGAEGDRPALFGELLGRHRAVSGLTQEELAERAGLSVR